MTEPRSTNSDPLLEPLQSSTSYRVKIRRHPALLLQHLVLRLVIGFISLLALAGRADDGLRLGWQVHLEFALIQGRPNEGERLVGLEVEVESWLIGLICTGELGTLWRGSPAPRYLEVEAGQVELGTDRRPFEARSRRDSKVQGNDLDKSAWLLRDNEPSQ